MNLQCEQKKYIHHESDMHHDLTPRKNNISVSHQNKLRKTINSFTYNKRITINNFFFF